MIAPRYHKCIHSLNGTVSGDQSRINIDEEDRSAIPEPFILFIVVERKPVDQTLVFDLTEEAGFPVITDIIIDELKILRAAGEYAEFISTDMRVVNGDVLPPIDADCYSGTLVGIRFGTDSLQCGILEIDSDILSPNRDDRGIRRGGR